MFWPTTCSADDNLYSKNNTSCIWSGQERLDLDSYSHHLIPAPLVEQQPSLNLSFILISPTHLILFHLILLCWHKSVHRQTPGKTLEAAKKGATICFDDTRTDRWKQYQLVKSSLHDHFCVKSFNCYIDIGPKWTFLSLIRWGLVLCTQKNTVRLLLSVGHHEKLFKLQERLHVQCNQVENNVYWHIAYQEKSSHVCPKEEDKSDHSTTFNPHPCSWWWSPRPCRRRARLDLSGRWRSGRGWWRRAWRGCCLRRSAPGYESWPHRRRWWSTCRCRWCSAWGQREDQSQRERERISSSGQVAMTQSESCRQPTVWETPWPQRLNAAFVLRPKCLTVCKHSGVFIAPETFVSPQTHRLLKHAASKKRSRILKYL